MDSKNIRTTLAIVLALVAAIWFAPSSEAQVLGGRLGKRLAERRAEQGEDGAVSGTPFGVGRVTIPLAAGSAASDMPIMLTEKNGRVFYYAETERPVRAALRELLNKELQIQVRPQSTPVYFLFTGNEPLDLTIYAPDATARQIVPVADAARHTQMLSQWWREYSNDAERINRSDEYPHVADVYLTGMLAHRLGLQPPSFSPKLLGPKLPDVEKTFGLLLGTEKSRLAVARETMTTQLPQETADQPLPAAITLPPPNVPQAPADVAIEPLASHVPEEWLYIRYGSFVNYQWFRKTLDTWGGDMRNLITLRGLDYNINARVERQLSLHESPLAPLLGPAVMSDVALVGDDPFMREGAAIGMLFQARSSFAMANDFGNQRAETLQREKDATEQKVQIGGHEVSFLSTPDNRVRSFYAVDGDFHLVTTSRRMVERFYEAGAGTRSLAQAPDFRFARSLRKPDAGDQLFVYLSQAFFGQLASPQYQIEMTRRLRSTTDIELFELARWAARNEGKQNPTQQNPTLGDLTSGGFLPAGFGQRADGSRLEELVGGRLGDVVRGGARLVSADSRCAGDQGHTKRSGGVFAVRGVVRSGLGSDGPAVGGGPSNRLGQWRRPDGAHCASVSDGGEVEFSHRSTWTAGWQTHRAGGGRRRGDRRDRQRQPAKHAAIEYRRCRRRAAQPYHLFAGIRGGEIPQGAGRSGLLPAGLLPNWRFYLGSLPGPGILSFFGAGNPATPLDSNGFGQANSFYQRQMGQMTVISPQQDLLAEVTPQLKVTSADDAQVFLHVGDLSNSKLAGMANQFGYSRARTIALGNMHYLQSLTTQLGVPQQQAMEVAERLADARLVSPLGGSYELLTRANQPPIWFATGLRNEAAGGTTAGATAGMLPTPPSGFQTPPLDWFRGLDLRFKSDPGRLMAVDATVLMLRPVLTPPPPSPAAGETSNGVPPLPKPENIQPGQSSLQPIGPPPKPQPPK